MYVCSLVPTRPGNEASMYVDPKTYLFWSHDAQSPVVAKSFIVEATHDRYECWSTVDDSCAEHFNGPILLVTSSVHVLSVCRLSVYLYRMCSGPLVRPVVYMHLFTLRRTSSFSPPQWTRLSGSNYSCLQHFYGCNTCVVAVEVCTSTCVITFANP